MRSWAPQCAQLLHGKPHMPLPVSNITDTLWGGVPTMRSWTADSNRLSLSLSQAKCYLMNQAQPCQRTSAMTMTTR
eukprot:6310010-Amphidinium_carterae.1